MCRSHLEVISNREKIEASAAARERVREVLLEFDPKFEEIATTEQQGGRTWTRTWTRSL